MIERHELAAAVIDSLEADLVIAKRERERNKQIYQKLLKILGNPNNASLGGAWLPDDGEVGEAVLAVEGDRQRRINPRFLSLYPGFTVPLDSMTNEMLLSSKTPYSKFGIEVSKDEAVPVICLEGGMLERVGEDGARRIVKSHILDSDGITRVFGFWQDPFVSIPKVEYWEIPEKVPGDLWENVLQFANGKWRKNPVLVERTLVTPLAVSENSRSGLWTGIAKRFRAMLP